MRKIKHYSGDCFDFHKAVLNSKRDEGKKQLIGNMDQELAIAFKSYQNHFDSNSLECLEPIEVNFEQKDALAWLYDFGQLKFSNLFEELTTNEMNRRDVLCPNCTVHNSSELDHYIPKSEFPEFSDNPLNLMPCCPSCNKKKTNKWRDNKGRLFLNLFTDDLGSLQYLFIETQMIDGVPVFRFIIDNRNNIDDDLFKLINSHYSNLELCSLFSQHADSVVDEIARTYYEIQGTFEDSTFKFFYIQKAKGDKQFFGSNYWKSILTIECISNDDVFSFIKSQPY